MQQLHDLYTEKMQQGGILNVIGYRQHFGQIRAFILDTITDNYIIPSGSTKFSDYLPQDNINNTAQAVYYGVMQNVQTTINTTDNNKNKNCPINLDQLQTLVQDKNQIEQIQNQYTKITTNQLATILNIILGKTDVICSGYSNITDSNPQSQTNSLDRLQQAGAMLSNLAKDRELNAQYLNIKKTLNNTLNPNDKTKTNTNNTNPNNSAIIQNIDNIEKELKNSVPLLKSASTWLTIVLPSILDFFLIIAIALFPIKIVMEMVIGSVSSMMMFIPNTTSMQTFAKHAVGIMLYIPCVILGYFSANVILNYVLELSIGLCFESMQYSLLQGASVDIEHFKTITMIFVSIGGAVTMMCASLILGLPSAVNRLLQAGEGDTNSSLATQKLDGSVGSAGAGSASMGQIFGAGSNGRDNDSHIHGGNSEQNKNTIKDKQQQVVSDEQGSVQPQDTTTKIR
jgi:hypothetical protein